MIAFLAIYIIAGILIVRWFVGDMEDKGVPEYEVLEDMSETISHVFPKLVPHIEKGKLLVLHRERGVILVLHPEDEKELIQKVVKVYPSWEEKDESTKVPY